jgi:hypothetical protein
MAQSVTNVTACRKAEISVAHEVPTSHSFLIILIPALPTYSEEALEVVSEEDSKKDSKKVSKNGLAELLAGEKTDFLGTKPAINCCQIFLDPNGWNDPAYPRYLEHFTSEKHQTRL